MRSLILIALLSLALCQTKEKDAIESLPQFDDYNDNDQGFWMYSGFLDIAGGKHIHYLFVESQYDKERDPVIIWFNGGPGCSSMLGWATEHGPYLMRDGNERFDKDLNLWSWNTNANVLYIEAPAGVGYSWLDAGYDPKPKYTDETSAVDNWLAIKEWLKRFPEYKDTDIYVTGESYAGIYVPHLVHANLQQPAEDRLNIKGMALGNPVTDWEVDVHPSSLASSFWHNLIDLDIEKKMKDNGCFPWKLSVYNGTQPERNEVQCDNVEDTFIDDILPGLNIYDVYRYCYHDEPVRREGKLTKGDKTYSYKKGFTAQEYTPWFYNAHPKLKNEVLPPCVSAAGISEYLNRVDVQDDLNVEYEEELFQTWDLCTDRIDYTIGTEGSIQFYEEIKAAGVRIMIYSGNTDLVVPTAGTREWIYELGWTIKTDWTPYYIKDGKQVGGYVEEREGLTFATIQGVGHMAPQWKGEAAYYLINKFIDNQPVPNSPYTRAAKNVSQ